ncbi:MAG: NADPH-dependent 7-cyano-7-deazaguanine reductase QueF [Gammaproteobacteria bacterium]|nr:NADPH-dependent 7-cyano-7-deazaguanine reductase QueF [Gammaproteobacteria bacterium]
MNMQTLKMGKTNAQDSELGKKTDYYSTYNADKLFPIPRNAKRVEIGINPDSPPFKGFDYWNHYEVSWLNEKGKPIVAIADIVYDCNTPNIIESKSMKLYFNSLNNTRFKTVDEVEAIVKKDLQQRIEGEVFVNITPLDKFKENKGFHELTGVCLDNLDVSCSDYTTKSSLLTTEKEMIDETLYSHLLKSNCLVTNQPDWGTVEIHYQGQKINHENLLKYIVSYRNHNEFHEQCIERIFVDIMEHCKPTKLTVYGRYTRRGGLDINPYRSTEQADFKGKNNRLLRQ